MNCRFQRPHASMRMFCFPWAGGGASFYTAWGKDVTEDIEVGQCICSEHKCCLINSCNFFRKPPSPVIGICLPGRETRFKEQCRSNAVETIDEIVKNMHDKYLDKPFIFFGHSMGAILAFLVAKKLKDMYGKEPAHMFLSGGIAPHSPTRLSKTVDVRKMTQEQFINRMKELGGTPPEVLQNQELMEIFIPQAIADYTIVHELRYEQAPDDKPPLTCPIEFFDGEEDKVDHDIDLWRQVTSGSFSFRKLPGGHFFLKHPDNIKKLIDSINLLCSGYDDIV